MWSIYTTMRQNTWSTTSLPSAEQGSAATTIGNIAFVPDGSPYMDTFSEPTVTVAAPITPAGGNAIIDYTIADAASASCSVQVLYSVKRRTLANGRGNRRRWHHWSYLKPDRHVPHFRLEQPQRPRKHQQSSRAFGNHRQRRHGDRPSRPKHQLRGEQYGRRERPDHRFHGLHGRYGQLVANWLNDQLQRHRERDGREYHQCFRHRWQRQQQHKRVGDDNASYLERGSRCQR